MGSLYDDAVDAAGGSYHMDQLRKRMGTGKVVAKFFKENAPLSAGVFSLETLGFLMDLRQKSDFDITSRDAKRLKEIQTSITLMHQEGTSGERPL